jgi:predicted pyridoxine 5'-phosphate oxidase superfamily flavin-nucleotide-binding protein
MNSTPDERGPFHDGELALQRATGERDTGAANGRIIVDRVIPNAVGFIARQELAVMATVDGDGRPWCSALLGPPGSFTVPGPTRVTLERAAARADDPLWDNLRHDPRVGLLFIEVATRRRYRVNGEVADPDARGLHRPPPTHTRGLHRPPPTHTDPLVVAVREALPNCPKYITRRHLTVGPATASGGTADVAPPTVGVDLGDEERRIIAGADVCFVASANPQGQLDASHRGGRPGFVELRGEELWVPDYPGNGMFNTLGNLRLNPSAGLLFVDFAGSQTLQLTGTTTIDLAADVPAVATGGTGRAWTFTPTAWRRAPLAARVRAEFLDFSPFNP